MYYFEMSGKKHILHPFIGKKEEFSKWLLMMTNKNFMEYSKVEAKLKVISKEILSSDFENVMTNKVFYESIICTKGNSRPVAERMLEEMAKGTVQYERTT